MNPLITKSLLLLSDKLGPSPTPQRVLEVLHEVGIANEIDLRAYVVGSTFYTIYGSGTRTARDIEHELAAQYELTVDGINAIRIRYAKGLRRKRPGRPKKS